MIEQRLVGKSVVAVMVAVLAALFLRSWFQVSLLRVGSTAWFASDLSYLIVPPILALLLLPLWRPESGFLENQFRPVDLTRRLILHAITIGFLLRLLWWSQLVAGVALGVYGSPVSSELLGPTFSFRCPNPDKLALGFLVTVLLTPLIEELVHRAVILSYLRPRGPLVAILVSATTFAALHNTTSGAFAFFAGLVFAYVYWSTRSLWSCLVAHGTFNALALLDWRCLTVQWNPGTDATPVMTPSVTAIALIVASTVALAALLHRISTVSSPPSP